MSTTNAVVVDNVAKSYFLRREGQVRDGLSHVLENALRKPFRKRRSSDHRRNGATVEEFWALRDVSFEVKQGEVVGIIGRNGAGKSTLLKILSRITDPTKGRVKLCGRVASLLEVGTGFHPELTGRENIFLNGAILGMTRAEIKNKFEEIVAFSEISRFIDTPVKRYSSGMYVRLAFAVAAHLEPEILIVDEVLAVGDAGFQDKCLGKMGQVAREGRTVLFVSHNLQAISTLTHRTMLIETGQIRFDGETSAALREYRAIFRRHSEGAFIDPNKPTGLVRAMVKTSEPNDIHRFGRPLLFEFELKFKNKPSKGLFSFQVLDENMRPVMWLTQCDSEKQWLGAGNVLLRCFVPRSRLYMGHYTVRTHVGDRASGEHFETLEAVCKFDVVLDNITTEYNWPPGAGAFIEDAEWSVLSRTREFSALSAVN